MQSTRRAPITLTPTLSRKRERGNICKRERSVSTRTTRLSAIVVRNGLASPDCGASKGGRWLPMPTRIENARRLRQRSTDAERRLWYFLRNRQLDGCRFRRQAPLGRYVADFVCVERRLVIELDGGQHFETATADRERARHFARAGYRVLRFWNTPVLQETTSVLESILAALRETGAGPHAIARNMLHGYLAGDESGTEQCAMIAAHEEA